MPTSVMIRGCLTVCSFFVSAQFAYALQPAPEQVVQPVSMPSDASKFPELTAYQSFQEIKPLAVVVPTVVEFPLDTSFRVRPNVAVFNVTRGIFEPSLQIDTETTKPTPIMISTSDGQSSLRVYDGDFDTFEDYLLPENNQGVVQFSITATSTVMTSALSLALDSNVALPAYVEVRAVVRGGERVVLAKSPMTGTIVRFPSTISREFIVSFFYSQPLRIAELTLLQTNVNQTVQRVVRFLGQPNEQYRIYSNPDRLVAVPSGEAGNLSLNDGVRKLPASAVIDNPSYVIADGDADGVPDVMDNCVSLANSDQVDVDTNGRGDSCDDFDRDGINNTDDNCPDAPNRDQSDVDGDDIGDVCDGEESRFTEQNPWLPWVGIGFAALVLVSLLALTLRQVPVVADER